MHTRLLIVGGGPVGLFLALKVGRLGIDVTVTEAEPTVIPSPRAIGYFPIVLEECRKVGILDDMRERGLESSAGLQWRNLQFELLAELRGMMGSEGKEKMVFLGQHGLAAIILEHIAKYPNIKVLFSHRFVGVQQNDKEVTALFITPEGEKFMTAEYLAGCDGAGSAVRHCLCIPFEGFTWTDFRFIASNMYYDFEKEAGWKWGSLIVDPEHWAVIVRTGAEGTPWRIAYGEPAHLDFSKEAIMQRLPAKYEKLLPGSKKGYTVENVNPYFAHQRCAKNFRVGKVTLCGDAAHANNPIGGLGLTTGILDAAVLGNVLNRILKLGESEDLLSDYERTRRKAFLEFTNPLSIANKERLTSTDPAKVAEREWFFNKLNTDEDFHLMLNRGMDNAMVETFEVAQVL